MNKNIGIAIGILIIAIICWQVIQTKQTNIACTMEAMLCPDGSYVGRVGPICEFAKCPDSIAIYDSGIRGKVVLGPTCPVERFPPDPDCADRPYKTTIAIFHLNDLKRAFLFVNSDKNGAFSSSLPPGEYVLIAGEESKLPRCNQLKVIVEPNIFVSAIISCDTGIR